MAERYITDPHTQTLVKGGLTLHQAALYECLARRGSQTASRASFLAGVPRTLGYKVLAELQGLELVVKHDEPGSVARFTAAHPARLSELANKKLEEAKNAKSVLDATIPKLEEEFRAVSNSPEARVLESVSKLVEELDKIPGVKLTRSDQKGKATVVIEYDTKTP